MMQAWRSGSRSSKLLFVAVTVFVLSIQFKSAFQTVKHTQLSDDLDLVFERPNGGWESISNESSEDDRPQSKLRGDGAPLTQQQNSDAPTINQKELHKPKPPVKWEKTSPSRRVPRGIVIAYPNGILTVRPERDPHRDNNMKEDSMPDDPPQITPEWFEPNADEFIDGYDWSVCEPMYDWQLQSFPNCNKFHELDLHEMRVINTGGSRIAMEMRQNIDGQEAKFVYKTVKYHKEITMKLAEEQRKDSLVMERTSSSKYIPDIHGYCSLGVMMDFMPEGE